MMNGMVVSSQLTPNTTVAIANQLRLFSIGPGSTERDAAIQFGTKMKIMYIVLQNGGSTNVANASFSLVFDSIPRKTQQV